MFKATFQGAKRYFQDKPHPCKTCGRNSKILYDYVENVYFCANCGEVQWENQTNGGKRGVILTIDLPHFCINYFFYWSFFVFFTSLIGFLSSGVGFYFKETFK